MPARKKRASRSSRSRAEKAKIPPFLVEYFLLGRTRRGAVERFVQDGGIVTDVWLAFAKEPDKSQRVLVSSTQGTSTIDLGYTLHYAISDYRRANDRATETPNVSPLENFVAATIYFDELVCILLPLTKWWYAKNLSELAGNEPLQKALSESIFHTLGHKREDEVRDTRAIGKEKSEYRRVLEAAPLAALIGIFDIARDDGKELELLRNLDPHRKDEDRLEFIDWIGAHAKAIDRGWRDELAMGARAWPIVTKAIPNDLLAEPGHERELIDRVFLDREAGLASEGNATIKADAAQRLFELSCRGITWAIIDSGIATDHPAFLDHSPPPRSAPPNVERRRIKATLDFTEIERIRSFDLIASGNKAARNKVITNVIATLVKVPDRTDTPKFRQSAGWMNSWRSAAGNR